ncbi:MAG: putative urease accessory protein [Acidimicrobiales bacterium]|nr:putative urease accessory protein [Acidimicrobiales bacterium]
MKAHAHVRAADTGWVDVRSDPPLSVRCRPGIAHLVGSAAGPLGGDDLALDVDVDVGASATVRSVAAQLVLPGPRPAPSTFRVRATVADGAVLRWEPEPTVVAALAWHQVSTLVAVLGSGRVAWREEMVLGRHAEAAGSIASVLRVVLDDRPLVHHELRVGPQAGPGWDGPGGLGGHRCVGTVVVVDPIAWAAGAPRVRSFGPSDTCCTVLPAEGPAVVALAVGSPIDVSAALDVVQAALSGAWPDGPASHPLANVE